MSTQLLKNWAHQKIARAAMGVEKYCLATLVFVAIASIIGSSYLGTNGSHIFRQADVYGHILGFMGNRGFDSFERFVGGPRIFDIPIYEYMIAKTTIALNQDPLVVTRYFNLLFWLIMVATGYRFVISLGNNIAGLAFIFFLATSPLFLHYFSVPLPDTMALAFSMAAVTALHLEENKWRAAAYAIPLLAIAALIKSPIPFVFLLFYGTYSTLTLIFDRKDLGSTLKEQFPFVIVLAASLFIALLAEQLGKILLEEQVSPGASWYFGAWDLRTSGEFWRNIWARTSDWGLFTFGYVYIAIVCLSIFVAPNKNTIIVAAAALIAFLGGWLVFANVYRIHDYYQLPVAVVIALSLAVSFSNIVDWIIGKLNTKLIPLAPNMIILALIPLSLYLVLNQDSLSEKSRSTIWNAIEYSLRDEQIFLYVSETRSLNPAVGGLVGTKFTRIMNEELERGCEGYLRQYSAVLVDGHSDCIRSTKSLATFYIENGTQTFFLKGNRSLLSKIDLARASAPVIAAEYEVYLEGQELIYLKKNCSKEDRDTRFFLHVYPTSRGSLAGNEEQGFQNLDIGFRNHGTIVDQQCIVVRGLPDYPISYIVTGQYVPNQGRTWEGTYVFAR